MREHKNLWPFIKPTTVTQAVDLFLLENSLVTCTLLCRTVTITNHNTEVIRLRVAYLYGVYGTGDTTHIIKSNYCEGFRPKKDLGKVIFMLLMLL